MNRILKTLKDQRAIHNADLSYRTYGPKISDDNSKNIQSQPSNCPLGKSIITISKRSDELKNRSDVNIPAGTNDQ